MVVKKVIKKAVEKKTITKKTENDLIKFTDDEKTMYYKILCVGRTKTGKTFFAGSFPRPFVINTDKGLATLKSKNIPYLTIERMTAENMGNDSILSSWVEVRQILNDLRYQEGKYWEAVEKYKPGTIILDSVSALSDLMEAEVIANPPDKKDRSDTLFLSDYNIIQRRLFSILDMFRELPYHVVATAGIDITQDEMQRILENPHATGSKLGPQIPHFFDEVYYHEYNKEKKVWTLTPVATKRFPHGGSRYGLEMTVFENPTFDKMKKYFK